MSETKKKKSRSELVNQGITLNTLRDRLRSLNARMLLAMQHHDEDGQEQIKKELIEVQEDIDCMTSNTMFDKEWRWH